MGEYAEMELYAQRFGKTTADLDPEEVFAFYEEYEARPAKPRGRFDCSTCGKRLRGDFALKQHLRDKHGVPPEEPR